MLSEAKHLSAHRARPFASLRVTIEEADRPEARAQGDTVKQLRGMPITAELRGSITEGCAQGQSG